MEGKVEEAMAGQSGRSNGRTKWKKQWKDI